MRTIVVRGLGLLGWALVLLAAPPGTHAWPMTTRVSVSSVGVQADNYSEHCSISADGRVVAFVSLASNLVSDDTNNAQDVFIYDRLTWQTSRVSQSSSGAQGNGGCTSTSISADGHSVAFASYASDLVTGDTNSAQDIFVHDMQTGETTRVSVVSFSGTQANGGSQAPDISADGRFIAFASDASNLVLGDTNSSQDVFVHDRQTGQTTRVSVDTFGVQANSVSVFPSISSNGRFVAFASDASNLVLGDTNDRTDIFTHDMQTGQTARVSVSSSGAQGNSSSFYSSISTDGSFIAFSSGASNLVPGDTNSREDIFVRDRQTATTTRVSVTSSGTQGNGFCERSSISTDGRFVAFESFASNLVPGGTNGVKSVFVHDRESAATTRASVDSFGLEGNGNSSIPSISADGRFVAFVSLASSLVPDDTNSAQDVFVHERGPPPCPADANGDGVVDFLDLNIVLSDFGRSGAPGTIAGDLDGDGVVDFLDLNIVLSNFGVAC